MIVSIFFKSFYKIKQRFKFTYFLNPIQNRKIPMRSVNDWNEADLEMTLEKNIVIRHKIKELTF